MLVIIAEAVQLASMHPFILLRRVGKVANRADGHFELFLHFINRVFHLTQVGYNGQRTQQANESENRGDDHGNFG